MYIIWIPQWLFVDPSLPSRDSSSKDATPRPKSGLEFSRQIPTPNRTLNARPPLTQTTIPRNRSRFCGTHLTPLAPSTSCKFSIQSCHHSSRFFLFLPNSSTFSFRPFIQGYRARELQDILVGRCCPRSSIIIKFWKPVSFSFSLRLNSPQKEKKTLTFSSKIIRTTDKDTLAHFFFSIAFLLNFLSQDGLIASHSHSPWNSKKKDCNSFINYPFPILGPEAELLYITFTNLDDLTIRDFKKNNKFKIISLWSDCVLLLWQVMLIKHKRLRPKHSCFDLFFSFVISQRTMCICNNKMFI